MLNGSEFCLILDRKVKKGRAMKRGQSDREEVPQAKKDIWAGVNLTVARRG